ncbi:hypothetical protein EYB25_003839 [Talaromyces marneffei]|nr:hypothetical protein EYB25_003839 [Talaromyces marneffei]
MSLLKAWLTPMCSQKPAFVHATECVSMLACPWCGQENPNKRDKEKQPQTTTTFKESVSQSRELRQKAIVIGKKFLPGRNNIGSSVLSAEKKTMAEGHYNLSIALYKPKNDGSPWFNGKWTKVAQYEVFDIRTPAELIKNLEPSCRELQQLLKSKAQYTPRLASTANERMAEFLSDTVLQEGFENLLLNLEVDKKKLRENPNPQYKLHICFGKYPELESNGESPSDSESQDDYERTINISDQIPDDDIDYPTDTTNRAFPPVDFYPQSDALKRRRASSATSFPVSKPKKKTQTQHNGSAGITIKKEKKADPIIKKEKEPFGIAHTQTSHEVISISNDDEAISDNNNKALGEAFRLLKDVVRRAKKKSSLAESLDNGLKVKCELEEEANLLAVPVEDASLLKEPAEQSDLLAVAAEESSLLLAQDGPASNTRRRHGKLFPKKHFL